MADQLVRVVHSDESATEIIYCVGRKVHVMATEVGRERYGYLGFVRTGEYQYKVIGTCPCFDWVYEEPDVITVAEAHLGYRFDPSEVEAVINS